MDNSNQPQATAPVAPPPAAPPATPPVAPPVAPPATPPPPAPPAPPAAEPTPPPADNAPTQDDQEWEKANQDLLDESDKKPADTDGKPSGVGAPKSEEGETPKPPEGAQEPTEEEKKQAVEAAEKKAAEVAEAEKAKNETPEQTEARHKQEAEEAKKKADEEAAAQPSDPSVRDARQVQRELAEDKKVMKEDIRKELFSDVKSELLDADGDPIKTIEDVQKLVNPKTGKPFTEEEAGFWLLQASQNLKKTLDETEQKIESIAETNLSLKDQADNLRNKYGELLKANPNQIRERIWAEFQKTLKRDEKTGIITEAPVSMESFYETALAPYEHLAKQMETNAKSEEQIRQEKERAEAEAKKVKTQSDRSDIYSGGESDTRDPEDKEWGAAAEAVFGPTK